MMPITCINKLVDYILLNACSVNSTGLYNGKSGLSLTLFEVSRYLKDEYLEDHAFNLLKESLLSKNEDIGFENGLAGVGYTLLYLMKNKFICADFNELFGEQHKKISKRLKEGRMQKMTKYLISNLRIIYYLVLSIQEANDNEAVNTITYISFEVEESLIKQMKEIEQGSHLCSKEDLLYAFHLYLKIANNCPYILPSTKLLDIYTRLYIKNKLICNFHIGYYLSNIADKLCDNELQNIGKENKRNALKNIYIKTIPLSQQIDLLYLLRQEKHYYENEIKLLERGFLDVTKLDIFETNILHCISPSNFIAGYQHGIARLLLYEVYRNSDKLRKERIMFL